MAKDDKKVLLIAQEIKLAKILAGNNKKLRERTLKRLGKWLIERTLNAPISDDVFMRIWKGLFYAMWMSDKLLVQEECAENIAKLIHLNDTKISLMFFKCFLQTMVNEWFGIDHHRVDKFLMLVRRIFRQAFEVLKASNWQDDDINDFREIINKTAFKIDRSTALGLVLHIDEIYLEELAKVSRGKLDENKVLELIQPFAQQLARLDDIRHVKHVSQHIFKYLMQQSDVGIEYKEKFHIWRRQGFPGGTMDSLEKVEIQNVDNYESSDEDDVTNEVKDPRAGKVDVVLPQLKFDPNAVMNLLSELKFKNYTTSMGRKQIGTLIKQFKQLADGKYPLGSTKVATLPNDGYSINMKSSVKRLANLENKLSKQSNRAKKRILREQKVNEIIKEQVQRLVKEKKTNKQPTVKNQPTIKQLTFNNQPIIKKQKNKKSNEISKKIELFSEDTEDFQKFITKSEAKLMDEFKNKLNKKRKHFDTISTDSFVPNPLNSKKQKHIITKEDLSTSEELDLSKIPTKNPNTFVRNSGLWLVEEFDLPDSLPNSPKSKESPKTSKNDKLDEWSKPLQNCEKEYFVVSTKIKKKLKRLSDNKMRPLKRFPSENIFSSPQITKSSKKSIVIVKNPFSNTPKLKNTKSGKNMTPKSEKKIKFSEKNHAQDFSDHLKQILSSPGIPYDSKKKPVKPLLKQSPISSPINPFYKKFK